MRTFKLVILLVILCAVLALAVQNTETVTLRFLVWELSMSRFLLVLVIFLLGFLMGAVAPRALLARASSKS